jgi:hypothetical protein
VTPGTAQPGAGDTFNISVPATSTTCGEGAYTLKVDCVRIARNEAQFTALGTSAHGSDPFFVAKESK